ncbi:lipocalin-like domain-containing protein [uncultured Desulfobulbus sp.]|uniref:lipocalin-like domain-containing protein n=1 Tax=uncultured Desulfobulbus sp. TaxID=239745 RepID=UPI0029C60EBB|nr:lipocalin-like domain-containing protein [uncultured Desulfobulbus sp.]
MKSYVKGLVVAVQFLAIFTAVMFGISDVWAKEKGGALEKQIQGTWTLVSIFVEKEGEKIDVFGANPRGSMILTPNGRFSVIMMKSSLPKFAATSRIKGTTEENQAVVQGSLAWFGSYKIANAKENMVVFNIEGSTFPNWDGEEQKLFMNVTGDEMKVINPAAAIGGKGYPTWKRVK